MLRATYTAPAIESSRIESSRSAPAASRQFLYYPLARRLTASVLPMEGVSYNDGRLVFRRLLYSDEAARMVVGRAEGRSMKVAFQGLGKKAEPTKDDLAVINQHASETLTMDDVRVFERYVANDAPMRSPLKFTRRALVKFAEDFVQGRGVHLDHLNSKGFGRTFAADVVEATVRGIEANWLRLRFYAVTKNATAERLQLLQDVASGVLSYDSITFMAGRWTFHEVSEGEQEIFFFEVDDDDAAHPRLEATEVSVLSVLGNVYGAGSSDGNANKYADVRSASDDESPVKTPPKHYYYARNALNP